MEIEILNAIFKYLCDNNVDCKIIDPIPQSDVFRPGIEVGRRCLIEMLVNSYEIAIHKSSHIATSIVIFPLSDPQLLDKILTHVGIPDTLVHEN